MMLDLVLSFATSEARGILRMSSASSERLADLKPVFQRVAGRDPFLTALLTGIAWTESDFVATARNKDTDAAGLMQIMPFHFRRFGWQGFQGSGWSDPEQNIRAGLQILRDSGLGKEPIREVLRKYGGFVTKDPTTYVHRVLTRSAYLLPRVAI